MQRTKRVYTTHLKGSCKLEGCILSLSCMFDHVILISLRNDHLKKYRILQERTRSPRILDVPQGDLRLFVALERSERLEITKHPRRPRGR